MLRLSTARAIVLGSVIAVLCLTLNACSDSTTLAPDVSPDATLRRGANRPGSSGWKSTATSLELAPDGFSIVVGATSQLSVTARNRKGTEVPLRSVGWRSSDTTVARVASGTVTALKAGTALISATFDGLADTVVATVTSAAPPVDSIALSPASASLVVGQQLSLTAEPMTADGVALAGAEVSWSSSDTSIATVTASGRVTGVKAGDAAIKASAGGKVGEAALTIEPVPAVAVASVVLSPSPISVTAGQTVQLSAATKAADGTALSGRSLTWSSSNDKVATVSSSGLLTGVGAGTAAISVISEGAADTASAEVAPSVVPVASVVMSDSDATLMVGDSKQLVATPRDADGTALTGRTITWASSRTSVATVSSSGLVKAVAAGSASVTATVDGKSASSAITVEAAVVPPGGSVSSPDPDPTPTERVGFYVAPSGSSGGSGTKASPWDLNSVLSGNKSIPAGDTVWVRGGKYIGQFYAYLSGSASAPVVIRQYPGERATIDGNLVVVGSHLVFWGLEVMNSNPLGVYRLGVNNRGPSNQFINLVVHDAGASGIYLGVEGSGSGVYGSLVYNNGTNSNQDHGIYANNNSPASAIEDNIIFDNQAYGLHGYTSIANYINNIQVRGNVSFNNGLITNLGGRPDLFVGGSVPATGIVVTGNYTYRIDGGQTVELGYGSTPNGSLTYQDNYLVGRVDIHNWSQLTQGNNTILTLASHPSATQVFVRPNKYEAGRANVIVYNWGQAGAASADLSGVLRDGDSYEIRNAQDFYGAAVASGTFSGGSVTIPLSPMVAVRPLGRASNSLSTGTQFGVFVVLRTN
ncbi:MAG TPA: Ig-like domain-containing protein [Gemmatimonadales bacterium]|nr:Ig-like domain-containing protein [Gemmatimonadales bacterium]